MEIAGYKDACVNNRFKRLTSNKDEEVPTEATLEIYCTNLLLINNIYIRMNQWQLLIVVNIVQNSVRIEFMQGNDFLAIDTG